MIKDFLKGKIAVQCHTEEQAYKLLRYCQQAKIEWNSGTNLLDNIRWQEYKSNTVYVIEGGRMLYDSTLNHILVGYKTPQPIFSYNKVYSNRYARIR